MSNSNLRDKVLELEPYPEDLKATIREKMAYTKERPLKGLDRSLTVFGCVAVPMMLLGIAVWIILIFDTFVSKVPAYIVVGLVMGLLLGCWTTALLVMTLKRGTLRPRDGANIVYATGVFMLYMYVGAMFSGIPFSAVHLTPLIIGGACLIVVRIEASELRLRKHALRNELALVELSEHLARRDVQGQGQE
jgi:hypothetical protein